MKSEGVKPKKKAVDRWIDTGLVLATLLLFAMILHRLNVRKTGGEAVERPAAVMERVETEGGIPRLSFSQLERVMPDENGHPAFPPGMLALDGETVRIQGFMSPFDSLQNMKTFMLFPFPTGCNFCEPPAVNQVVLVRQKEGQRRYGFIDAPILITGTLRLWREDSEDSAHSEDFFLYVMEDTEVIELEMDPIQRERFHRDHQQRMF
ncbi:MAG: DUF3299 domain-containing protein [Verrucomicrobia bacterium]|nr:DUF3299 domain-containing protein [Verrucomicrobiota bacterium]MCH8525899.1 DUF3299 domain-containing protein [Kiritimatiellia bacterium]